MATAKKSTKTYITLELTEDEAVSLYTATAHIGGPPTGRRGHFNDIAKLLHEVGVKADNDSVQQCSGSIYFK